MIIMAVEKMIIMLTKKMQKNLTIKKDRDSNDSDTEQHRYRVIGDNYVNNTDTEKLKVNHDQRDQEDLEKEDDVTDKEQTDVGVPGVGIGCGVSNHKTS